MVECPRCGGYGGEDASNFGDHGWHPCYACGETGFVSEEILKRIEENDAKLAEQLEKDREYYYD